MRRFCIIDAISISLYGWISRDNRMLNIVLVYKLFNVKVGPIDRKYNVDFGLRLT